MLSALSIGRTRQLLYVVLSASVLAGVSGSAQELGPKEGELTKALDFTSSGKEMLGRREVYVLKGTPRADYHPPNKQAKALTGMQGTLWIDAANFHWVKAEAEVVRPVWIYGFVARIEPGTRFELEQSPIAEGLWMPNHFIMDAKATVFLLFPHYERDNITYFSYHRPGISPVDANHVK